MLRTITYALQFRGEALRDGDGLVMRASAPPCRLETKLYEDGVAARFVYSDCLDEALLDARLLLDADGTFSGAVAIDFGCGHELKLSSLGSGYLSESADPSLSHGSAILEVTGGAGQFEGATGRVLSDFLVSDTWGPHGQSAGRDLRACHRRLTPTVQARLRDTPGP